MPALEDLAEPGHQFGVIDSGRVHLWHLEGTAVIGNDHS